MQGVQFYKTAHFGVLTQAGDGVCDVVRVLAATMEGFWIKNLCGLCVSASLRWAVGAQEKVRIIERS
jgi:hypothetical protein